jgi:hypothetical protein
MKNTGSFCTSEGVPASACEEPELPPASPPTHRSSSMSVDSAAFAPPQLRPHGTAVARRLRGCGCSSAATSVHDGAKEEVEGVLGGAGVSSSSLAGSMSGSEPEEAQLDSLGGDSESCCGEPLLCCACWDVCAVTLLSKCRRKRRPGAETEKVDSALWSVGAGEKRTCAGSALQAAAHQSLRRVC